MRSPLAGVSTAVWALVALPAAVSAATWTLTDYYDPQSFLTDEWNYFDETDPTAGLVTYQTMENAVALNLSYINDQNQYVMGVSTVEEQLEGRPSVRIYSNKNFTDGLYILNATHMPSGCSVWPAWWTVTSDLDSWPNGGEIDIMENVNNQYTSNLATLHTNATCVVNSADESMTGTLEYSNCTASTGCRVIMNGTNSVAATATGYNQAGGGIYAMERSFGSTGTGIRIWYFSFDDVPDGLLDNATSVDTSSWPTPAADFPVTSCRSQFEEHQITFTTTLCGTWAGPAYNETSCAATYGSCSSQVAYNGSSYDEAYWAINHIRVFASGGGTAAAAAASDSGTSTSTSSSASSTSTSGSSRSATLSSVALVLSMVGGLAAWSLIA